MAYSGTFGFRPSLGQTVLYSYNQIGIRPTEILQQHMSDAHMAANLVLASWSNRGVDLWQVELITTPLVTGQATYDVNPNTVVMLDTYVTVANGDGGTTDRILLPISRSEYASYSEKSQQGFPTVYWNDRLLAPTVTLWPVPNGQQVALKYYALRQAMDANLASGQNVEIPYLWLKAFTYALAIELAVIWAPERLSFLLPLATGAYDEAASTGTEIAQMYVSPMVGGYFRP